MNVLINFATLKKGGGQNVALNFLECLLQMNRVPFNFFYVVVANSEIHKYLKKRNQVNLILAPQNPLLKIGMEVFNGRNIVKRYNIHLIYSYFGVGVYPKTIPQVSGSADSNLYFPEIDFWKEYSGIKKVIRKLIDSYRIWGLKRMAAIIFENEMMLKRGIELYKIQKAIYIKPSINVSYENAGLSLGEKMDDEYYGLFLCSWQRNKNFMIIPLVAFELKKRGFKFKFIFTANRDESVDCRNFENLVAQYNVQDMIMLTGQIKKAQIASLYQQIDVVFLLSKLESFSNNIIEAWHFERPLFVSDALWSKSLCKDAAIYVNRDDPNEIAGKIVKICKDVKYRNDVVSQGKTILSTYPSIAERTEQELEFLKHVYESY